MAVPSSGTLSLRMIAMEVATNSYTTHPVDGTGLSQLGSTSLKYMSTGGWTNSTGSLLSSGSFPAINTANAASDRPDGSAPHAMSEFYSYDQDKVGVTSFTSALAESAVDSCSQTLNQTYYHNGSGARPVVDDIVYTNSGGTTLISNGTYRLDNNTRFVIFGGQGVVTAVDSC